MTTKELTGRWDATEYFRRLTDTNRLARDYNFRFFVVSDLQGFADAINSMQETQAFVCVSDISDGALNIDNTPHIRQVKTVFLAMRHSLTAPDSSAIREKCFDILRELFRQFMTVFAKESTYVGQGGLFINPTITFTEINRYFMAGCACAYFQIAVTKYANLTYNPEEWM